MPRTEIHYLEMKSVKPNSVYLFLGRRKSGKTTNIVSILKHFSNSFDWGVVFCGSVATAQQYANHIPSNFIHNNFDTDLIQKLIDRQESKRKAGFQLDRIFILADDCAFAQKSFKTPAIKSLCFNGRHYNITFFLSLQYALGILPSIRGQIDFVFASREKNVAYRRKIYENYSICFDKFKEFDSVMKSCTENHETFVLSCASATTSDKVSDNVFYYKSAFPMPEFKMNPTGKWWKVAPLKKYGDIRKIKREMKVNIDNDDDLEDMEDSEGEYFS